MPVSNLNELGIGLVYFQGFERFLASHSSLIDVVEIEPQTFWFDKHDECDAFKYDPDVMSFLCDYDRPKLFHGVGYPIGGTCLPSKQHFNTLRQQAKDLNPEWISEHLSFNLFKDQGREINSGFLLPPLQSAEGIKTAVANIKHYKNEMNFPFAFETGVNYLQPRGNEIPDGLFAARIAEEADCNILLDLHNILTNQRNGRQTVKEFLNCIPYERVVELHVGGGFYYKNYYLDAHSGAADNELLDILEDVVGKLPNLKALMFEITPEAFAKLPEAEINGQLIKMKRIFDKKGRHFTKRDVIPVINNNPVLKADVAVAEWEYTLGNMVLGKEIETRLSDELAWDMGISVMRDLIFNFRGSILVSMLKLTTRLLRLSVGEELFRQYVLDFFNMEYPDLLPVILAEQFAAYICSQQIRAPYLDKILEYELATIHTALDKQSRSVTFDFDPVPVIDALQHLKLPSAQQKGKTVTLRIVSDRLTIDSELLNFNPVIHN